MLGSHPLLASQVSEVAPNSCASKTTNAATLTQPSTDEEQQRPQHRQRRATPHTDNSGKHTCTPLPTSKPNNARNMGNRCKKVALLPATAMARTVHSHLLPGHVHCNFRFRQETDQGLCAANPKFIHWGMGLPMPRASQEPTAAKRDPAETFEHVAPMVTRSKCPKS